MTHRRDTAHRTSACRWQLGGTALALLLTALGLLQALAGGDLRYAFRVLIRQDSDPADVRWRPRSLAHPSPIESRWPAAPRCATLGKLPTGHAKSLVVVHDGQVVCEWYGNGGRADLPTAAFSISKTVVSLLLARAIEQKHFPGLDVPITLGIPELHARDPRFSQVTMRELVDMRSGIAFSENTSFPWVNRDYPKVYYATDLARIAVERPVIEQPAGRFVYNDYAPNLVGLAYQRMTGIDLTAKPFQELWDELGAEHSASWSLDDRGFAHHESGLAATARDLARVGQLMIDRGKVAGRQVAPRSFLDRSFAPDGADAVTTFKGVSVGYYNGWWHLPRPAGGTDLLAMGAHGQVMLVSPATRKVVVRLGTQMPGTTNIDIALQLQLLAIKVASGAACDPVSQAAAEEWTPRC
jgi:CubicO group peptidase (beta-lactamase class C family)